MKYIDIIFDDKGNILHQTFPEGGINQYSTDYLLRVTFTKEFELDNISYISAVIKTNKNLPERILYVKLDESLAANINGEDINFPVVHTYQFSFFDTQFYQPLLELTVCVKLRDGTEFNSGILYIPMNKAEYSKPTVLPLDYDSTLTTTLERTTESLIAVKSFLDNKGSSYRVTPLNEPGTVMSRDEDGISKVSDPVGADDVANKRYVDMSINKAHVIFVSKLSEIYTEDELMSIVPSEGYGAVYIVSTEGYPPLSYYRYKGSEYKWEKEGDILDKTLYINSEDTKIYKFDPLKASGSFKYFKEITVSQNELETLRGNVYDKEEVDSFIRDMEISIKNDINDTTTEKLAELVGAAPDALNTLNELANALGNNPNFSADILSAISGIQEGKLDKITTSSPYSKVYTSTSNGEQGFLQVAPQGMYVEGLLPRYTNNRTLVGDTPQTNTDLANKKYVDDNISNVNTNISSLCVLKETQVSTVPRAIYYPSNSSWTTTIDIADKDENIKAGSLTAYMDTTSGSSVINAVLVTGVPVNDYQAANKKYVDDTILGAFNAKIVAGTGIDLTMTGSDYTVSVTPGKYVESVKSTAAYDLDSVYATKSDGTTTLIPVGYSPYYDILTIPTLSATGQLYVGVTPTSSNSATSKQYVDDSIINAAIKIYTYSLHISGGKGDTTYLTFTAPKLPNLDTALTASTFIKSLYDFCVSKGYTSTDYLLPCNGSFFNGTDLFPLVGIYVSTLTPNSYFYPVYLTKDESLFYISVWDSVLKNFTSTQLI